MRNILLIAEMVISIALITAILLQRRGSSLGGAFGGGGAAYYKKRGAEKILFSATIVLSALFLSIAFVLLFL
jgi:preprotein translocase subunit SecG